MVAPLDWGLGHAARCVPIVNGLLERGAVPVLAADNGPLALLRSEFPQAEAVRLPGVTVRYATGASQFWSMARQLPALVRSVSAERAAFDRMAKALRPDAVISDQRFGVRSAWVPSVLITHQLFPFTPFAQRMLRRLNQQHIGRFDRCWVMDEPLAPGLAGDLSHGPGLPANARYIGPVSRMGRGATGGRASRRVVAVISGPEPQRTLLERILLEQLELIPGRHLLVQGLPQHGAEPRTGRVEVVNHLGGADLREAMASAELIVSRSGYTTLMDLALMGRSALIIPTPGQQEQEYLGRLHARTGRFLVQEQHRVDLSAALAAPAVPAPARRGATLLHEALDDLAALLR